MTKTDVIQICKKYDIKNYTVNRDLTVDVDGGVSLFGKNLTKLPVKFGKVADYFNCAHNLLTTLEGCPNHVSGTFDCIGNKLTTLEGCPQYVGVNFWCSLNKISRDKIIFIGICNKLMSNNLWKF